MGRAPREPATRRVFFALWPGSEVRRKLSAHAAALHAECGGREMRGTNIHLTLVFIGSVAAERLSVLEATAAAIAAPGFELTLDTLGYWRHNRIAWAGASAAPRALEDLVARLAAPLRASGFRLDARAYVPHVTLVRDARRAPAGHAFPPIVWRVADFVLVESVPAERGVEYQVVARWPLAA